MTERNKKRVTPTIANVPLRARVQDSDGALVGAYFTDLDRYNPVSPEEEQRLFKQYRAGDQSAKKKIIQANLRFVVKVAQRYMGQGVPFPDLISEGNQGLIYAIDKFDPDKNFKFISYAVWWIRQAILKVLSEQSRIVSIPLHQTQRILSISRTLERFMQKGIFEPTIEEVADETGLSQKTVRALLHVMPKASSLDAPIGNKADMTRMDALVGDTEDPLEVMLATSLSDDLHAALLELSEVERVVIMYMFGFKNDYVYTLNEVGDVLGVSRERVRQIKDKACKKLSMLLCSREKAA